MDVNQMILDLRAERDAIAAALAALEGIAASRGRRRGRPPAWLSNLQDKKEGSTRVVTQATKRKMAMAQRRRWAAARSAREAMASRAEA